MKFFAHAYALKKEELEAVSKFKTRGVSILFNAREFNNQLRFTLQDQSQFNTSLHKVNLASNRV